MEIAHIAVDIDWHVTERTGTAPLIASRFQVPVAAASEVLDAHVRGESVVGTDSLTRPLVDRAHRTLLEYVAAVQQRDVQYEARQASIRGGTNGKRGSKNKRRR